MDHILFIAAVLVAIAIIVAIPVSISRKQARARKAVMKNAYAEVLTEHGLKPSVEDEFTHRIISLDTSKNVFVSMHHHGEETPFHVVRLDEVKECEIRKTGRTPGVARETNDGISLAFLLRNGTTVDVPVYSEIMDGLTGRIEMNRSAEKWQQLIRMTIGRAV